MNLVSKNLMTLAKTVAEIPYLLEETQGEITPEIEQLMTISSSELVAKIDSYQYVLERLELEQQFAKEKAAKWAKVAKTFENTKQRIKENIKDAMKQMQTTELVGEESRFVLTKVKPSLNLFEEDLTDSYKMIVQTVVPDKEKIRADLELGVPVPGATLEQGFALRSYPASSPEKSKKAKKSPDELTIRA